MASIRSRTDNSLLFFDFRFNGKRCREQTLLPDTPTNRKKLEKVLARIESEIAAGTFVYESYFPSSKALNRLNNSKSEPKAVATVNQSVVNTVTETVSNPISIGPRFKEFANKWVDECSIEWRRSHIRSLLSTLNGHLIPHFGDKAVGSITKSDILAFRAQLAKVKGRGNKEGLSPKRINEIIGLLRQILNEAADRFEFTSPVTNIKKLRQRKTDIDPFSMDDMQRIIGTVRADYRNYFITRFLTGMRTGEVHGLKWKYVDFDMRIIRVRETFVLGEDEYTKTDGSQRDIQMSQPVWDALKAQFEVTGAVSNYVFCNLEGLPLDNKNFSDRIWYPLLRNLGLTERRPYQMRHTCATLWLASGEAPEWIARQLGHTSTEMLFRVYSRFVPNLTRQDGSAMERLLAAKMSQGPLIEQRDAEGNSNYVPASDISPQPIPKLRGVHAAAQQAQKSANKVTAADKEVGNAPSPKEIPVQIPDTGSQTTKAQTSPLNWAAIAQSWQQGQTARPVD